MTLTPNILKTDTKEGDHTMVRKWYLEEQIFALKKQVRKVNNIETSELFNSIAQFSFASVIMNLIEKYETELNNWHDRTDEYNS